MSQRKKLMKALAAEVSTFTSFDHVVHGGAVKIAQAAKDKNMVAVIDEYQKLLTGCQSCHSIFKARLSTALK
jgi:cytochrome c556